MLQFCFNKTTNLVLAIKFLAPNVLFFLLVIVDVLPPEPSPRHDEDHDKEVRRHPEARHQEDDSGGREGILLTLDLSLVRPVLVLLAAEDARARNPAGNSVAPARHDSSNFSS